MTIRDIMKESWLSISGNKLRSFLTVLGIIIGVMAVVIMVAVGETVQQSITDQFSSLGTNTIVVRAGAARNFGVRSGSRQTLTITDAEQIKMLNDFQQSSTQDLFTSKTDYPSTNSKIEEKFQNRETQFSNEANLNEINSSSLKIEIGS